MIAQTGQEDNAPTRPNCQIRSRTSAAIRSTGPSMIVAELTPPRSAIRPCVRDRILSWKKGVQRDVRGPVGPRTSLVLTALAAANS